MFFLAGLLGMMALGSVAIITTASSDDPVEEDGPELAPSQDPETQPDGPLLLTDAVMLDESEPADALSGASDPDGSLFSRMGVINQSSEAEQFSDPAKAEEVAWLAGTPDDDQIYDSLPTEFDDDTELPGVIAGMSDGLTDEPDAKTGRDAPMTFSDTLFGGWENDLPDPVDLAEAGDLDDADDTDDGFDLTGIAEDEQVIIVYDDSPDAPEPNVVVRPNAMDPERTEIVLNDLVVSTVPTQDAPAPEALALVGESLLKELALETA